MVGSLKAVQTRDFEKFHDAVKRIRRAESELKDAIRKARASGITVTAYYFGQEIQLANADIRIALSDGVVSESCATCPRDKVAPAG